MNLRKILGIIGFLLMLLPGIGLLWVELTNEIGQSNPFLIAAIVIYGGLIALLGFFFLLFSGKVLNMPLLLITAILFNISAFPILGVIGDFREKTYLKKHNAELEQIAQNILNGDMTEERANTLLMSRGSILKVYCVQEESQHVLFLISGLIDNCYGFSYSLVEEEPEENCCGDLTSWEKIEGNWFVWTTT